MHRADWRDPLNKNLQAKEYYRTGKLDDSTTKFFMNKPDAILPKDEFGVVNNYDGIRPNKRNWMEIEHGIVKPVNFEEKTILQWDMPRALNLSQINDK